MVDRYVTSTASDQIHIISEGDDRRAIATVKGPRAMVERMAAADALYEALIELADLMDEVEAGDYKPDSFTTQPARNALAKATGEARMTAVPDEPQAVASGPDHALYIRLTDDGQHIRKWDRKPFDGATIYYLDGVQPPVASDATTATPDHALTALIDAARQVLDRMFSTYKARNGREVGIEGDDGEKCWIVHSDDIETLRRAATDNRAPVKDGWRGIESAPRDGTRIVALHLSPWRGESRIEVVWWQDEFAAFITRCNEMTMAPGYTIDGQARKLHSPDVFEATHWLCAVPAAPTPPNGSREGER